jgi:hypothetical protein
MGERYQLPRISYYEPRQLISATGVAQGASHNPFAVRRQETLALRSDEEGDTLGALGFRPANSRFSPPLPSSSHSILIRTPANLFSYVFNH